MFFFFFSSRRRHTRLQGDWSSDVCSSDLVNAASAVLKEHCLRSNAGLFYGDGDEFAEALQRLVDDPGLRRALAEAGRRYVEASYRWPLVLDRYRALIEAAAGS